MTERDNPEDDEQDSGTFFGAIRLVIQTLIEAEREDRTSFGKTGKTPGSHFTTEYGFSGQIGEPRRQANPQPGTDTSNGQSSSDSGDGLARESGKEYMVDIRETDDGLLVVADMPNVEADDISAGIDEERDEFVVGVDDEQVERMELPWPVEHVEAQFRHGILELRFTREEVEE